MLKLFWVGPTLFCDSEIARVPSGAAGIYILHVFARTYGGYPVFYVGKSLDLRRRLTEHLSGSCKECVKRVRCLERAYFSAAAVPAGLLDRVESGLIRTLKPICNDQVPTTEPLLVNLPPITL